MGQRNVEQLQITDWVDVERHLLPGHNSAMVRVALDFYRRELTTEFANRPVAAYLELLGVDFHSAVEVVTLDRKRSVATFLKTAPPLGTGRPNEGRVRRDAAGNPLQLLPGAFLTDTGTDPGTLGISTATRRGVHLRVLQPVRALRSRASGIVDNWTERPMWSTGPGTARLAQGGGIQYRVPRQTITSGEHFAIL